jgi:hypothetical protein
MFKVCRDRLSKAKALNLFRRAFAVDKKVSRLLFLSYDTHSLECGTKIKPLNDSNLRLALFI